MSSGVGTQARAFADEVRGGLEQKNWMLDLGHPLLNRIAESFVKAAGVSTRRCPLASAAPFYFLGTQTGSTSRSVPLLLLIPCISADRRGAGGREGIVLHGNRR
jgi:hypothetical protein